MIVQAEHIVTYAHYVKLFFHNVIASTVIWSTYVTCDQHMLHMFGN